MEGTPNNEESFDTEKSPMREAYALLGAKNPLELDRLYTEKDQELMKTQAWDYANPALITNRIKEILETVDEAGLTESEQEWRDEILWFWYHHAISCAIWRYHDQRAARVYSAKAFEYQRENHPNKITRLFYYLTRDQLQEAEHWAAGITEEPEKETAQSVLENYKNGRFYTDEG